MVESAGLSSSEALRTTARRLADTQWVLGLSRERIRRGADLRRRRTRQFLSPQDRAFMDLLLWLHHSPS